MESLQWQPRAAKIGLHLHSWNTRSASNTSSAFHLFVRRTLSVQTLCRSHFIPFSWFKSSNFTCLSVYSAPSLPTSNATKVVNLVLQWGQIRNWGPTPINMAEYILELLGENSWQTSFFPCMKSLASKNQFHYNLRSLPIIQWFSFGYLETSVDKKDKYFILNYSVLRKIWVAPTHQMM